MKYLLCSVFFSAWTSAELIAQVDLSRGALETKIINIYESFLADKVTNNLLSNYKSYIQYPNEYWDFLNETFLDNWDFESTTKALIGSEIFNSMSKTQFTKLSRTVGVTLIRYAFESLSIYAEQKLNVVDVSVNGQQTFAWLKINMDSPKFPDIHLDLLLKRDDENQWKVIDFRYKGITYVDLKKNSYRQDFEDLKFVGLLQKLESKNKLFFRELCKGEPNYLVPTNPPCL